MSLVRSARLPAHLLSFLPSNTFALSFAQKEAAVFDRTNRPFRSNGVRVSPELYTSKMLKRAPYMLWQTVAVTSYDEKVEVVRATTSVMGNGMTCKETIEIDPMQNPQRVLYRVNAMDARERISEWWTLYAGFASPLLQHDEVPLPIRALWQKVAAA